MEILQILMQVLFHKGDYKLKLKNKKEKKPLEITLKILFVIRWFIEVVINYSVVISVTVYFLPMLLITVGKYVGVSYEMATLDLLMLLILPSLFIIGLSIILYCLFAKQIHKLLDKIYNKAVVKYRAIDNESKYTIDSKGNVKKK